MRIAQVMILGLSVGVLGCSNKPLHEMRNNSNGPDEFLVEPVKPLTAPRDYDVLPAPTPGGSNLVDLDPRADAVDALGGSPEALKVAGVPASDQALVTSSSRYGVTPGTREQLAQEDAEFRKRQARWSGFKLFPVDRYSQAYRRNNLEPFPVNEAFRRSGRKTPTAPAPE